MTKPDNWLRILLLIGCGFLALTAWSVYRAGQDTSDIVDRDYYSHGLRYNQSVLEQQAVAALGWTTAIELNGHQLQVSLADRQGQPVTQAAAVLTLMPSQAPKLGPQALEEVAPGRYQTVIPQALQGDLPAEISFDRQGTRFSRRLLLFLNDDH